jgi:hypothetical protein
LALFRDIECGTLDAKGFHGDVEVEHLGARLHELWVPCSSVPRGSYVVEEHNGLLPIPSFSLLFRSGIIQRSSSTDIAAREYKSKFVIPETRISPFYILPLF